MINVDAAARARPELAVFRVLRLAGSSVREAVLRRERRARPRVLRVLVPAKASVSRALRRWKAGATFEVQRRRNLRKRSFRVSARRRLLVEDGGASTERRHEAPPLHRGPEELVLLAPDAAHGAVLALLQGPFFLGRRPRVRRVRREGARDRPERVVCVAEAVDPLELVLAVACVFFRGVRGRRGRQSRAASRPAAAARARRLASRTAAATRRRSPRNICGRGFATRLCGISTRRRRDSPPRKIHVAAAASPRPASTELSHVAAAARLRGISHVAAAASPRLASTESSHVAASPRPTTGRGR